MTVRMRIALKIAYDGAAFYGHQRQPDARTVEGEAIAALTAARIIREPHEAFFRSASRTDRGVSAVGNVIAFNTSFAPGAAIGAFNDRARDVWAWAFAVVPEDFHPRGAEERWYRYHLFENVPLEPLLAAARLFVGEHDLSSFTSDPPQGPHPIRRIDVRQDDEAILIDVRARSFRRGMVRRIVAAMLAHAGGDVTIAEIEEALRGRLHDFGVVPPEPLVLMDVAYGFPFEIALKPKVRDEWRAREVEAALRLRFLRDVKDAVREI